MRHFGHRDMARVPLRCDAARAAGVGLCNNNDGTIEVFSQSFDLDGLFRFAGKLRASAQQLDALRIE